MNDFLGLSGKNLLITGATSGIGKATCELAVNFGARVLAIGRKVEQLDELKAQFPKQVQTLKIDFFDSGYLEKLALFLTQEKIYGFVHAAGISPTMPINRESRESWEIAMQLNVYIGIEIAQLLIRKQRSSIKSIVYISSVMADLAEKAKGTYSMSKGALNAVMRNQALEYAKFNVRANAIAPAVVQTPLSMDSVYRKTEKGMKRISDKHPLGLGEAEDVAKSALFLLSDASSWITGTTLTVDGGYSIA